MNIYAPSDLDSEKTAFFEQVGGAYGQNHTLCKPDYMAGDFNIVEPGSDPLLGLDDPHLVVHALWDLKLGFSLQDTFKT